MKRFLINVLKFTISFSVVMALMLLGTFYIWSSVSFEIPQEKDIIIIGDSHTESAVNDNIFLRSVNISQSADAYFYSYMKLRKFLRINPHINKVILSFHGGSIGRERDDWITGEEFINSRVPRYIYLFNKEDFFFMIKKKCFISAILKTPKIYIYPFFKLITKKDLVYSDLNIGHYLWLDKDKLDEDIESKRNIEPVKYEYSLYQLNNLLKIVELCRQYNIELIFFNSPTYASEIYGRKNELADYYNRYFSTIKYLDFSDFILPLYGYGNIGHLNYKGAEIFSLYLENNYETLFYN
jgi:hypothetical protein